MKKCEKKQIAGLIDLPQPC